MTPRREAFCFFVVFFFRKETGHDEEMRNGGLISLGRVHPNQKNVSEEAREGIVHPKLKSQALQVEEGNLFTGCQKQRERFVAQKAKNNQLFGLF